MSHHQPYDPYYHYHLPDPTYNERSHINTLFISGLPDDVKAREIHNLFRRRPGFDSCQLKYTGRGSQVVAFATFFNHQTAIASLQALNGVKFDPQSGSVLHVELARSNSRRKHKPGSGAYVVIDKRTKVEDNASPEQSSNEDGNSDEESSGNENPDSGDKTKESIESVVAPENAISATNDRQEKTDGGTCSTLFIANLGPNCTEDELKEVLRQYPGFNILKLRAKSGMPVAFADFEKIEQATKAMEELQDSLLPSSDRGGMHIEYARSKMRRS